MEIIFLISITCVIYAYFGYPASLYLLSIISNKKVNKNIYYPTVTIIITVYNEEKKIRDKIINTLGIEYPRDKLQIIIASDGSNDKTIGIAEEYRTGIEILNRMERTGKENTQKEAIKIARGDIFVFTDVATMLESDGLVQIVSNFSDNTVGCVSSEDRLVGSDGKVSGEGFYVRYEMWLRRLESKCNSIVGLSGSFFAARKIVCDDFSGNMQSDFRTVLSSIKKGLRCIIDPMAIGYYMDVKGKSNEFDRKVRTVLRGLTVYFNHAELLNVFKYGLFSYQYFCHKLLRWIVPVFLVIGFISNVFISVNSLFYQLILSLQVLFYGIALVSIKTDRDFSFNIANVPKYFLVVNASIVMAWWKYIRRQRIVFWNPSER